MTDSFVRSVPGEQVDFFLVVKGFSNQQHFISLKPFFQICDSEMRRDCVSLPSENSLISKTVQLSLLHNLTTFAKFFPCP